MAAREPDSHLKNQNFNKLQTNYKQHQTKYEKLQKATKNKGGNCFPPTRCRHGGIELVFAAATDGPTCRVFIHSVRLTLTFKYGGRNRETLRKQIHSKLFFVFLCFSYNSLKQWFSYNSLNSGFPTTPLNT